MRVWLNPPYGNFTPLWMEKLARHGNGIALIYARTETKSFFPWVWQYADGIFFFSDRLRFFHVNGKEAESGGGAPSVLVAYGESNVDALRNAEITGTLKGRLINI